MPSVSELSGVLQSLVLYQSQCDEHIVKNALFQAKFNEDITVEKVKQTLGGLNYTEVNDNVSFKKKKKKKDTWWA